MEQTITAPDLRAVQERRRQLFGLLLLVFALAAGGVALFSYATDVLAGDAFTVLDVGTLRVSFIALCVAFALYVWEKERSLSRIERELIEERVRSAALRDRLRELTAISRAGRGVASVLSLDDALVLVLQSAQELLGATEGSVMLLDRERNLLRVAASVGLGDGITRDIPVGESVSGWVAEFREPVVVTGDRHPRFRRFIPKGRDVRSAMSAPLYARGEPVGVLNVSVSRGDRRYTDHDLRAFTVLAEYAAIAIANAHLFQERQEAVGRLEALDADRREFLAIVTHDLRAPLTAVIGYANVLQQVAGVASAEEQREYAEVITRQGRRMLEMVEQLIMVASIEEGSSVLAREPLDVVEIARDTVRAFAGVTGDREVLVVAPEGVPAVSGDAVALRHVLSNLLDNAIKYSPERAPVEVVVETDDDAVNLEVLDRGPGIPPALRSQLFERYSRGGDEGGFGLGLFIVRSLTEGLGGYVRVDGREGGGTVITVSLPRARREASAEAVVRARG